jgi:Na+-translocating ferredoxin:NAD+ oxidoreductase RnfC subunit
MTYDACAMRQAATRCVYCAGKRHLCSAEIHGLRSEWRASARQHRTGREKKGLQILKAGHCGPMTCPSSTSESQPRKVDTLGLPRMSE